MSTDTAVVDITDPAQVASARQRRDAKRAAALAEAAAPSSSSALSVVEVLSEDDSRRTVMIPVEDLHPHPANPRRDLGDLTELADSIRAHGIRQNLLAVPNPDPAKGGWRIVIGHRRTAAARLAGRSHMPTVVDETLDEVAQRELMLLENLQRTDLSPMEEADAYQGLLDLGLTQTAIARSTGRAAKTVRSRLALRRLGEQARTRVHAGVAALEDAAAVTALAKKYPDLAEQLEEALGTGFFRHRLEAARREAKYREQRAALVAELEAAGVQIVDDETGHELRLLRDGDGRPLAPDEHTTCPGHAVNLEESWGGWAARPRCLDYVGNGHTCLVPQGARSTPGHTDEDQAAERRRVLANNKASRAAEAVRVAFLQTLLQKLARPEGWQQYVALMLLFGEHWREDQRAVELIFPGEDSEAVAAVRPKEYIAAGRAAAEKFLIAKAAARAEMAFPVDFWRSHPNERLVAHLRQLQAWGYTLAEIEAEYLARAEEQAE